MMEMLPLDALILEDSQTCTQEDYRRQAARAETLLRAASSMNAELDLHHVLKTVCEEFIHALKMPNAVVMLYEDGRDVLQPVAAGGFLLENLRREHLISRQQYERLSLQGTGLLSAVDLESLQPVLTGETKQGDIQGNLAGASMVRKNQLIGLVVVFDQEVKRPFSEEEQVLLLGLAHQAALAISNAVQYDKSQHRYKHMQALRDIDIALVSSMDLRVTLNVVLDRILARLGVDAADVLLLNPLNQRLEYSSGRGFRTAALKYTRLNLGEGYAGTAAVERRLVRLTNLSNKSGEFQRSPLMIEEGFEAYFGMPLIVKGQVKGVLEIFNRSPLDPDAEWLSFFDALCMETALAIGNVAMFGELQRASQELGMAYEATIEGWSRAIDLREKEGEGHTQRVAESTLQLARLMGFPDVELVNLRRGALLHDLGKIAIPDSILLKPSALDEEEWAIMRQHPVYAYDLLSPISYLRPALDIPYSHHEKWDGSGYPQGLAGEAIPLPARIFAVVDVWDALLSNRPFRKAWKRGEALQYIRQQSGAHFDPQVVQVFLDNPDLAI